jgi:hypothetical protein
MRKKSRYLIRQRPVGGSFVIDGASKPLWQHATSRRAVTWKAVQHEYAATSRVQHEADRRASADVTNSPILGFAALAESFLDAEQRIAERRYFYTSRRRHLADVSRSRASSMNWPTATRETQKADET